jgi:serine/threonine protein kinase
MCQQEFNETVAKGVIRQVLDALAYLHSKGIAHRDLKPGNLVYKDREQTSLRIVDFGFARSQRESSVTGGSTPSSTSVEHATLRDHHLDHHLRRMQTNVGTPRYMAPEIVSGRTYELGCDIWSTGVMLFLLLSGTHPFSGKGGGGSEDDPSSGWNDEDDRQSLVSDSDDVADSTATAAATSSRDAVSEYRVHVATHTETEHVQLAKEITTASYTMDEDHWGCISAEATDLVQQMLTLEPTHRPTAKALLEHAWFGDARNPSAKAITLKQITPLGNSLRLDAASQSRLAVHEAAAREAAAREAAAHEAAAHEAAATEAAATDVEAVDEKTDELILLKATHLSQNFARLKKFHTSSTVIAKRGRLRSIPSVDAAPRLAM